MAEKVKVSTVWMQECAGCHMSFLDLNETLLAVLDKIQIVRSPIMDIKDYPKAKVGLVMGCVNTTESEEVAHKMRESCDVLMSFGTCACFGGVPGLRNIFDTKEVLKCGYVETVSTVDGKVPQSSELPKLLPNVKPLHDVVKVDYYLPGCPPTSKMILSALTSLLEGKEPVQTKKNLCHECPREHKDMLVPTREFLTDSVVAPMELDTIDPHKCFLEQGVLCMGPATRGGCEARCMKGNMPCRGCMGPTPAALEQGAKMINALASVLPAGALMFMEDIVGTGYRYSLPVSICPFITGKDKK